MTDSTPPVILYCANHPTRETSLRCNRCEKPICTQCAVLTPTGYRCKDCVRVQQKTFDTAETVDYPIAVVIALILSFIGSLIASRLGFFTIFIAPIAGIVIAEAIRAATRRHRSKQLYLASAGAAALGSLPLIFLSVVSLLLGGPSGLPFLLTLVFQVVYTFLVVSTLYYRLGGISL